jgi:hypothetical protein
MQRDQAAGRPLEIDAIGGALLRRVARAGVDAPMTTRLVEELRAGRSRGIFRPRDYDPSTQGRVAPTLTMFVRTGPRADDLSGLAFSAA